MPSTTIKIATMSIAFIIILSPPPCLTELVEGGDPTSIPPNPPLNRPQLEYLQKKFKYFVKYFSTISSAEVFSYVFLILLAMSLYLEPGFLGNGHTVCDPVSLSAQYNRIVSVTHNCFNPRGRDFLCIVINGWWIKFILRQ